MCTYIYILILSALQHNGARRWARYDLWDILIIPDDDDDDDVGIQEADDVSRPPECKRIERRYIYRGKFKGTDGVGLWKNIYTGESCAMLIAI